MQYENFIDSIAAFENWELKAVGKQETTKN